jgi:hypothetical protein
MFSFWGSKPAAPAAQSPAAGDVQRGVSAQAVSDSAAALEEYKRRIEAIRQEELRRQAQAPPPPAPAPPSRQERELFDARSVKQLGLFFAGAGFLALSTVITRRSIARRHVSAVPKFYNTSSNRPLPLDTATPSRAGGATSAATSSMTAAELADATARAAEAKADGPLMAINALGLATLNVISFGVLFVGGLSYAFDICNMDELRAKARQVIGGATGGRTEEEAEAEVEEWIARVLSKRDKGKAGEVVVEEKVVLRPGEVEVVLKGDR